MDGSAARLMHELSAIKSYLSAAQDVVKSGHMPDITGLENRVAVLCEQIQNASHDIQKQCMPELLSLLEELNACEKTFEDSQNQPQGNKQ